MWLYIESKEQKVEIGYHNTYDDRFEITYDEDIKNGYGQEYILNLSHFRVRKETERHRNTLMDPHKHLIKFKSQDRTTEIQSAEFDQKTGKWTICFHGNPPEYHCNPGTVEVYQNPEVLNPEEYHFLRNGRPLYKIKEVLKFGDEHHEYRFWFENGNNLLLREADIEVIHNCLTGITEKKAMEYFHAISEVVSLKTEEGGALLSKQLENLGFIGGNVVLSSYLNPQSYPIRTYESGPLIFPFGCNESQKKAVEQAFMNQLTVIEGPPGTGKTQTILNIIANILIQGKTVAVVSNNNSATMNVYEKLKKKDLKYLWRCMRKNMGGKCCPGFENCGYILVIISGIECFYAVQLGRF